MLKTYQFFNKSRMFVLAFLLVAMNILYILPAEAATNLRNKSVELSKPTAGSISVHKFKFDIPDLIPIGSIAFEYCESPLFDEPCEVPSGLDASGASLDSQSGQTGFSVHPNTVSGRIVITRPVETATAGTVTYNFSNITNPDIPSHTTYVRITTYDNVDASGMYDDYGAVAFSIVPSLGVNVFVPPYLTFCTAVTVGLHCENSGGLSRDLGNLSSNHTASTTTQFAGATNDPTGYNVAVLGTTMTSGNNEITALNTPAFSRAGSGQFGINLRDNSQPNTGHNVEGGGTLVPVAPYGSLNIFKFRTGDVISSSSLPTDFNRMTITYIVNVRPDQHPGVYSTTLTYVAVASF